MSEKEFVADVTLVRVKTSLMYMNNRRVSIVNDTIRVIGGSSVNFYNIRDFVNKKVKVPEYTGSKTMASLHFDNTNRVKPVEVSLKFVVEPENHGMLRYFIETYNNLIEKNKDVMKTKVKDANSYDMHYRDSLQPYSIINKKSCEKTEKKLVQDELNRERRTGQKSPYLSVTNPVTVQKLTEKRPSPKNMIEASDSFYDRSGNENRKPIVKPNGPRPSTLSTTPKRNGLLNAPRETSLRNTPQNQGPVKRKFPDDKPDLSCHSSPRNNYLSRSAPVALSPKPKYGGETNSTPVDVYRHRRLENTGNSCYFNATMQALSALPSLVLSCWRLRRLDSKEETRQKYYGFLSEKKFKVLQGFLKMIYILGIPDDELGFAVFPSIGSPRPRLPQFTGEELRNIRLAVGRVNKDFDNSEQQDAHEYLVTILGIIDDLMEVIAKRDNIDLTADREAKYGSSIASLNPATQFKMKVETLYRCQKCGFQTFKTELRSDLCLIINEETDVINLLPAFVKWSALEKTCGQCKHAVASSCERIVNFPKCLIINLKRYERVGDSYQKKSCSVEPTMRMNVRVLGIVEELDVHPELDKTIHGKEQEQEHEVLENTSSVSEDNNNRSPEKLLGGAKSGVDSADDDVIIECEDNNPIFEFKCLSEEGQLQEMLNKMRIKLKPRQLEVHAEKLQELPRMEFKKNDPPKTIKEGINGDGNCFYRAVSWCLTGSQSHHAAIRESVYEFVRDNKDLLSSYCAEYKETSEAVKAIKGDGNWACATDIIALSTCFNIEIYTYLTTGWTKYCPREHPSFYQAFEKRNGAIYLQNTSSHYEPVLSISTASPDRYPLRIARKRTLSDDEQNDEDSEELPKKKTYLARPQQSRANKRSSDGKSTGKEVSAYSSDPGRVNYMLSSVICHEGTGPDKGHYVAYTKGSCDSTWTFCSDRTVHTVDEKDVIEKASETGYVLFYSRVYK